MIARLFGRGERAVASAVATLTAPEPFPARAQRQLDALSVTNRAAGADLEPAAYSQLRRTEDLLRPVILDAVEHPILPEREFAIETMLTDLIPSTVTAYCRIPERDRQPGSAASASLLTQLGMLSTSATEIAENIKTDAVTALQANAILLQQRLR
ncbi:hypothetical protein [Microbacterium sp. 77mftsu3.1]|uniref:hypothetical protein n=1 Tax=Microbacterium sp. 77mftsu3.1 TaxID=1761802 RepID=UPI00035E3384|nr:hypothetical protein [Microbacterium sp. 77mftsu3.1]SDH49025.1 hypothetical protein SAMN04488590_3426 [Microbacterium sp. 77mftsu3.1]